MDMHHSLFIAFSLAALAAIIDLRTGHIPNVLTVGALMALPPARALFEASLAHGWNRAVYMQLAASLGGAAVCALVPLLMLVKGTIGGGDVKLLAALGACLGPLLGIEAEFYAFVAASFALPLRLAYEGRLWKTLGDIAIWAVNPRARQRGAVVAADFGRFFRMGPAMALGTLVTAILHWRAI